MTINIMDYSGCIFFIIFMMILFALLAWDNEQYKDISKSVSQDEDDF